MASLLAPFGSNPFSTPVGQKIEKATDATLETENWSLNMEICDIINNTDTGPKDAVKAIKKRLQQNMGKNNTIVLYTLTVLETCVKNCNTKFLQLINDKDFVQELVKVVESKSGGSATTKEKVLGLIQSWADAFYGNPEMQGIVQLYQELKKKGIEFPMTDLDAMAPIVTPQRTIPQEKGVPSNLSLESAEEAVPSDTPSSSSALTAVQLAKLNSELDVVEENVNVLEELLTELTVLPENSDDVQLLKDLYETCTEMQKRVTDLLSQVSDENVINELLRINDKLNNAFLRYERYRKTQLPLPAQQDLNVDTSPAIMASTSSFSIAGISSSSEKVVSASMQPVPVAASIQDPDDKLLIDFSDDDDIDTRLSKLELTEGGNEVQTEVHSEAMPSAADIASEFDMFAQSRTTAYKSESASSYADNTNLDQIEQGLASYAQSKGRANSTPSKSTENEMAILGSRKSDTSSLNHTENETVPQTKSNDEVKKGTEEDSAFFKL